MRRTLEIIFRHPLQLLILVVLLPIIGVVISYILTPKMYQSTGSVWAWHRYSVISPTGPESDLNSTPAQTQATALTELLQTRKFALDVIKGIDLESTMDLSATVKSDPQQLEDALFAEIAKNVVVTPQAYQLYTVSYANKSPEIAQKIVASVIQNFGTQSTNLTAAEGQNLLTNYQTQLKQAQERQNQAVQAQQSYAASHRNLTPAELAADPEYQQLDASTKQATANVQNIQDQINVIQQSLGQTGDNATTLYQIVDTPQVPQLPLSRAPKFLIGGGIGLGVSLLADAIYLIILVRRDRSIYSAYDLQDVITLPVLMQLPTLTPASAALLVSSQPVD